MEPLVTAQLMEKTWRAVGAMSEAEIRRRQGLCGKEQEELTGFVLAYTADLAPEALGLALYAHLVIVEAFRRTRVRFNKLKPATIERTWKENFGFINDLKAAGYGRAPFQLRAGLASEPAIVQYAIDALTEDDEDDPITLADEDFWHTLQVLKTVADCMHAARRTI